jgi:hypothetical protein
VNLDDKTLRIARTLEMTKAYGPRFKEPKTRRGSRTIAIDDALATLLIAEREKHLRIAAGVADGGSVDLSLIKLPEGALVFPSTAGAEFDFTRPRHPHAITGEFVKRARKVGFPKLRFHDLRGTHETLLLDAGIPVHVVAARCGHDPAVLLRVYARRTFWPLSAGNQSHPPSTLFDSSPRIAAALVSAVFVLPTVEIPHGRPPNRIGSKLGPARQLFPRSSREYVA